MDDRATPRTAKLSRSSLAIAALSTIVEWYDFTLYLYFATVLSRVFLGAGEKPLLLTLGGFALSYTLRPLGALAFGQIGDRHGRRRMLLMSVALMTVAMLGIALLPTAAMIGPTAATLLFLFRCLTAFAVGGEYTGVVAYLLESAPVSRRGLIASLAPAASAVGALIAAGASALTVTSLSPDQLNDWGWRLPFFFGALLAAGLWIARRTMQESPEFERQSAAGSIPDSPLRDVLRHRRRGLLQAFAISAMGSITYYVGISYVPTFLQTIGKRSEGSSLWLSVLPALAVIVVTPMAGGLSDRIGRKPVLAGAATFGVLLSLAMFSLMAAGNAWQIALAAIVLAAIAGAYSAVGASATAEQFPGEGRLSGLALGVTMATAIFGGLTPLLAEWLSRRMNWPAAPGAMIAAVGALVLPVLLRMRETRPAPGRLGNDAA